MNRDHDEILSAASVLDSLTKTLLYEGYALYPYHRSAVKNQKPVPFGVVFPQDYHANNPHANSEMQTQCIVSGNHDVSLDITVRFLHLKKIELFQRNSGAQTHEQDFIPISSVTISNTFHQPGWQTIEHKLVADNLPMADLLKEETIIPIDFQKMSEISYMDEQGDQPSIKEVKSISEITGSVSIKAAVNEKHDAFQVTVKIINRTPIASPETITRDDVLTQSFLSTHTILHSPSGIFISHQDPGENWKEAIDTCENINAWPILIDKANTTILSSPIILYDYPEINPQSPGDLFDSTEIEEALLLHVAVLSEAEKERIAQSDDKLKAMLNKVSNVSPEELINFHSSLKQSSAFDSESEKPANENT